MAKLDIANHISKQKGEKLKSGSAKLIESI